MSISKSSVRGHPTGSTGKRTLVYIVRPSFGGRQFLQLSPAPFRVSGDPVTSSMGVTDLFGNEGFTTLHERADKLLYGAKSAGRNRTRSAIKPGPALKARACDGAMIAQADKALTVSISPKHPGVKWRSTRGHGRVRAFFEIGSRYGFRSAHEASAGKHDRTTVTRRSRNGVSRDMILVGAARRFDPSRCAGHSTAYRTRSARNLSDREHADITIAGDPVDRLPLRQAQQRHSDGREN